MKYLILSNGGSAVQIYITNALTDKRLYEEFTSDRRGKKMVSFLFKFCFIILALMNKLYHYEYLAGECSTLPITFYVESPMDDTASNTVVPFDTSVRTMLDEIMMWCVTANLPEDLVRFLLSLLPDFNFKVIQAK